MQRIRGLSHTMQQYIQDIPTDFPAIPEHRKSGLAKISAYVSEKLNKKGRADLVFICTHNSRRSHMGQFWARVAAFVYDIHGLNCFSGGTEATAFNPRSVKALRKAGFEIKTTDTVQNPVYTVRYTNEGKAYRAFSKKFEDPPNPRSKFGAVMTCSQADEACPLVHGAEARISIPYDDPKEADGTPEEEATYDERCRQIATEMFYMASQIDNPR